MRIFISIFVTVILTILNGFFSMSEMALSTAKRVVLEHDAEEGDRKAAKAVEVSSDSASFLAAIQVAITLVGFFSSAFAATTLSDPLSASLVGLGVPADLAATLATVLITLFVSYFSIVVGELVPKRIAMADAEGVAKKVAGHIDRFSKLTIPLVWLTSATANGISRILGVKGADDRQDVSEDEIKYLVEDSDELTDEEKSMIHDVLDLGDAIAREVMVPRVDMCALENTTPCSAVLERMRETGLSRVPIYEGDVDHIVGIAHIKDIISPIVDGGAGPYPISGFVRPAMFVPDTKDIIPLLSEMQGARQHLVIVTDEYGGTAGLISVEDIVEEIVGEIADEFDPDRRYIEEAGPGEWVVDGRYSIDDAIELGWPIEDSKSYETMAGFILEIADSVPSEGDAFVRDGHMFAVEEMHGRRISTIRVMTVDAIRGADGEAAGDAADSPAEDTADSSSEDDSVPGGDSQAGDAGGGEGDGVTDE